MLVLAFLNSVVSMSVATSESSSRVLDCPYCCMLPCLSIKHRLQGCVAAITQTVRIASGQQDRKSREHMLNESFGRKIYSAAA